MLEKIEEHPPFFTNYAAIGIIRVHFCRTWLFFVYTPDRESSSSSKDPLKYRASAASLHHCEDSVIPQYRNIFIEEPVKKTSLLRTPFLDAINLRRY